MVLNKLRLAERQRTKRKKKKKKTLSFLTNDNHLFYNTPLRSSRAKQRSRQTDGEQDLDFFEGGTICINPESQTFEAFSFAEF